MSVKTVKITMVRVRLRDGKELELSPEEARELFDELATLFKKETPDWGPRDYRHPFTTETPYYIPCTSPIFIPGPTTTDPLPPRWETICGPARSSTLEINLGE